MDSLEQFDAMIRTKADKGHTARLTAGIDQVGGGDTAQGFEFDYVGVIFGRNLRWDPASQDWIGDSGASHDSIVKRSGDRFTDLVQRTCRVLLTRGLKGCYVYFEDEATLQTVRAAMLNG